MKKLLINKYVIVIVIFISLTLLSYFTKMIVPDISCQYYINKELEGYTIPITSIDELISIRGTPDIIDTVDQEVTFVIYKYQKPYFEANYEFKKSGEFVSKEFGCKELYVDEVKPIIFKNNVPRFDSLQNVSVRRAYGNIWKYFDEPNLYSIYKIHNDSNGFVLNFMKTTNWKIMKKEDIIDDDNFPFEIKILENGEIEYCITNWKQKCVEKW